MWYIHFLYIEFPQAMSVQYLSEDAYMIDCRFDDFDNLCSALGAWNLDFRQIEAGSFAGRLLISGTPNMQFTRAQLGRRLIQKGAPPENLITFGLLAKPEIQIYWRGQHANGNQLFIFPEGGELEAVSQPDFDVLLVSLSKNILEMTCEKLQLPVPDKLISQKEVIDCDFQQLDRIRQSLLQQEQLMKQSGVAQLPTLLGEIERDMARDLTSLIAADKGSRSKPMMNRRAMAISRALDYMEECSARDRNLVEMCEYTQVSQRTLEYAFKERFQMTPKSFMLASRLNRAKKALLNADPKNGKVHELAKQSGFRHMSQFSTDYRKLFGELPSETLKKKGS